MDQLALRIFRFFSVSSLWIAFGASFGPMLLCQIYGLAVDPVWPLTVFLATFAVYLLDKGSDSKEDLLNTPDRAMLANWPIKKLVFGSYLLAIILLLATYPYRVLAILSFGIAGIIYTKKICGVRPKDITGAKNLIVALATAVCHAGVINAPFEAYLLMFLLIFVGTIIFDLRDIKGDAANNVLTIPVKFGRKHTNILIVVADLCICLISPIVGLIAGTVIFYFRKERSNLAYDLICDGWLIWMWAASLIIDSKA